MLKIAKTIVSLEAECAYSSAVLANEYSTNLLAKTYGVSLLVDAITIPSDKLFLLETGFEFLLESGDGLILET